MNDLSQDANSPNDAQLAEELRRIAAAKRVLKHMGLDIFDCLQTEEDVVRYQSVLALWQNADFQRELEKEVLAELKKEEDDQ